jgi:ribosomal protein S18 acetylase RimI-like enzyme
MITIRTGNVEDIDAVLALWNIATTVPSATDDAAGVEQLLADAPDGLILAFDGDTLVGTVIALFDGWRGAMYRLAIIPSHRRRGIATQLSEEGERQLRKRGARRLHMVVAPNEPPAEAFWRHAGYDEHAGAKRFTKTLAPG